MRFRPDAHPGRTPGPGPALSPVNVPCAIAARPLVGIFCPATDLRREPAHFNKCAHEIPVLKTRMPKRFPGHSRSTMKASWRSRISLEKSVPGLLW